MRPLNVLLISDDRPGHYHLAEGVIAAIARLRPVGTSKILARRRRLDPEPNAQPAVDRPAHAAAARPARGLRRSTPRLAQVDLIVSAGGETLVPNAAVASPDRQRPISSAGRCGACHRRLFRSWSRPMPSTPSLPRHVVALKPSGIDPDRLPPSTGGTPGQPPDAASPRGRAYRRGFRALRYQPRTGSTSCIPASQLRDAWHTLAGIDLAPQPTSRRRRSIGDGGQAGQPDRRIHRFPHGRARHACPDIRAGRSYPLHGGIQVR